MSNLFRRRTARRNLRVFLPMPLWLRRLSESFWKSKFWRTTRANWFQDCLLYLAPHACQRQKSNRRNSRVKSFYEYFHSRYINTFFMKVFLFTIKHFVEKKLDLLLGATCGSAPPFAREQRFQPAKSFSFQLNV